MSPIAGPGNEAAAGRLGDGRSEELEALTVLWFEGRMFNEGEPGAGGGGICWEDARRDEAGTELRSGMATVDFQ